MLDSGIKAGDPRAVNLAASKESLILTKRNSEDLEVVDDGMQR
jgi:hypothetical protein